MQDLKTRSRFGGLTENTMTSVAARCRAVLGFDHRDASMVDVAPSTRLHTLLVWSSRNA
jgi:hypothetical protein